MTHIGIAIVQRADQFLVGVRPDDTVLAGYDEFPGGKCEPNESPADCAVRECHEETGLSITAVRELSQVEHTYDHGEVHLHFWLCEPTDDCVQPQNGFTWVSRDELKSCNFPAANQQVVDSLLREMT